MRQDSIKSALTVAICVSLIFVPFASAQTMQRSLRELAPSASLRVIGGVEAKDGVWPWQVFIAVPIVKDGHKASASCGGSLIAPGWALSAAHCFVHKNASLDKSKPISVVEGLKRKSLGLDERPEFVAIHETSELSINPSYNPDTHENDIALLHLSEKAAAESVATAAALSSLNAKTVNGHRSGLSAGGSVAVVLGSPPYIRAYPPLPTGSNLSLGTILSSRPPKLLHRSPAKLNRRQPSTIRPESP